MAFDDNDAYDPKYYGIGDQVYFAAEPGDIEVVGTIVAIGKADESEDISYGIAILDGALRLPGAAVVYVPRKRIMGLTEQDGTAWHILLRRKLHRDTRCV